MSDHEPSGTALVALALTMAIDALTGEVLGALAATGIEPVLLKGPVFARWLYDDDEVRPYVDVDLLVSPWQHAHAETALSELGFVRRPREYEIAHRLEHDAVWTRPDAPGSVDLHRTMPSVRGASPEAVWSELRPHIVETRVPGVDQPVRVLDEDSRALLVGLHAAHHLGEGTIGARTVDDLTRALDRLPAEVWMRAASMARRLRAEPQLARGLSMVPAGVELAVALGLPDPSSQREEAAGFERLAAAHSSSERARLIARALVPEPSYLRWSSHTARRGRFGLVLAYVVRPFVLAGHLPHGFITWRRHRQRMHRG